MFCVRLLLKLWYTLKPSLSSGSQEAVLAQVLVRRCRSLLVLLLQAALSARRVYRYSAREQGLEMMVELSVGVSSLACNDSATRQLILRRETRLGGARDVVRLSSLLREERRTSVGTCTILSRAAWSKQPGGRTRKLRMRLHQTNMSTPLL